MDDNIWQLISADAFRCKLEFSPSKKWNLVLYKRYNEV